MQHVVSSSEANQRFSALLRLVRQGDSVIITSHGKEVAELKPREKKRPSKEEWDDFFAFLDSQPQFTHNWTREDAYN